MNRNNKSTKLSPAAFARAFPTLERAINGDRMSKEEAQAITEAAPTLIAAAKAEDGKFSEIIPAAELAALRQRKERGEEIWQEISALRQHQRDLEEEIHGARAGVRDLEKKMEALEEEEEQLISAHLFLDGGPGQGILPFTEAKAADKPDDVWMEVPTSVLVHNQAVAAKLVEHGLLTFGQVEAWRAKVNGPGGEDHKIKGFGPAKMQVVEDAVVKYWTDHPVKKEENSVASPAPAV